jgi:phosphomannomutase
VVAGGFDVGLAFDGDADRVFVVDETGRGLSGSTTTAMLASNLLGKHPGGTILHNLICSRAVPEVIRERGGVPIRTKVGHSFIKQVMVETGALLLP